MISTMAELPGRASHHRLARPQFLRRAMAVDLALRKRCVPSIAKIEKRDG
jgi:hypothetical protein